MRLLAGELDGERVVHRLANNVPQLVRRQEHFPGLLDIHHRIAVADGDFQISRGDGELVGGGSYFYALEDWLWGSSGDDIARDTECLMQGAPVADDFHGQTFPAFSAEGIAHSTAPGNARGATVSPLSY